MKVRDYETSPKKIILICNVIELLTIIPLRLALIFGGTVTVFGETSKSCNDLGAQAKFVRYFMIILICIGYLLAVIYIVVLITVIYGIHRFYKLRKIYKSASYYIFFPYLSDFRQNTI